MCARITITTTGTEIADLFGLSYDMSRPRPPDVFANDSRP